MRRAPASARPAFTLIELLVVVAIIAVLISILLPSLARAREQGRTVKCLSNLKGIGIAMSMYMGENKDWFPFEKKPFPAGWPCTAFYYGGHPGRRGSTNTSSPDYSNTFMSSLLRDTFAGRPFNRYMFDDLYEGLEVPNDTGTAEFEERRRPLEAAYGCPSDVGAQYGGDGTPDNGATLPTVYLHGTSYDINYHFLWNWAARTTFGGQIWPTYTEGNVGADRLTYLQRANLFLKKQMERNASTSVILYEDRFDNALGLRVSRMGWHQQFNKHSFLFLDAHAANIYANPKVDGGAGTGWRTFSGPWYYDPNDPDYQYRALMQSN